MAWNPYTDQKNRAYSSILTSLFPEQTKTIPRIIVWSLIFLADLILGVGISMYFGWVSSKLTAGIMIAAIVGIFWLQGFVWYKVVNSYKERNRIEPFN